MTLQLEGLVFALGFLPIEYRVGRLSVCILKLVFKSC